MPSRSEQARSITKTGRSNTKAPLLMGWPPVRESSMRKTASSNILVILPMVTLPVRGGSLIKMANLNAKATLPGSPVIRKRSKIHRYRPGIAKSITIMASSNMRANLSMASGMVKAVPMIAMADLFLKENLAMESRPNKAANRSWAGFCWQHRFSYFNYNDSSYLLICIACAKI